MTGTREFKEEKIECIGEGRGERRVKAFKFVVSFSAQDELSRPPSSNSIKSSWTTPNALLLPSFIRHEATFAEYFPAA